MSATTSPKPPAPAQAGGIPHEAGGGRDRPRSASLLRRTAFGAACIAAQPILLSALALPATAYVIRGLGPMAYGQWATATALATVVVFLTNLGLRGTFVRSVAQEPGQGPAALAQQLGLRAALALAAAAVSVAACALLGHPPVVLACTAVAALGLILTTVSTTAADLLQAYHRLPTVAAVNTAAGVALTAASVVAVWFGAGPLGVAASYLTGPAVSAALLIYVIQRNHFRVRVAVDVRRWARLLGDARFFAAQQLVASVSQNAEALIVPALVGPTYFGFFSAGTLLAQRLTALPDGVGTAVYPAIANGYRRHGLQAARRATLQYTALVLLACLPAAAAVTVLAGPIARLLFPGRAEVCEQVMRVTIWLLPLMGVHCVIGYALNAVHRDAAQARASVLGALCSLSAAAALTWKFGLAGACWSMVLRYPIQLAALAPCVARTFWPAQPAADDLAAGPASARPLAVVLPEPRVAVS